MGSNRYIFLALTVSRVFENVTGDEETVSWGMCHCVYDGRSTVILEEHTASLFRVYINP